ncbi:hypothetical protein BN8_05078 [Fibrisoma limi BUZ 3]|uniref:Outer membrane protein beta-barrel domain-containing protein n=1 Tax=Fibrisoma limi BUZ 3 TaxID=1185876 RepID=I2GPG3_9BACT|nr:outer membrane beta-barrel protein [Fibrisoma limi]CCH55791.1 hypothetical protein BN8_05078 [Fibrisoma limi BUZ 3]
MDTAYFRRCVNLHRSKVAVTALVWVLFSGHSLAQEYKYIRKHLERYDDKVIHYGFFFAAPVTRFSVRYSPAFVTARDSAYRIYSPNKASFRVGFVINTFLNDRFDLRLTPAVSLYSREVLYDYPGGTQRKEVRESTWLDFPLLLKYKSERRNNSRMYLLGGGSFAIETNVRRGDQGTSRLSTGTMDVAVEYGVGFEQFFEFFKFAPELRFSHGLVNLYRPGNNAASVGISKLTTHTVTLYLNFE